MRKAQINAQPVRQSHTKPVSQKCHKTNVVYMISDLHTTTKKAIKTDKQRFPVHNSHNQYVKTKEQGKGDMQVKVNRHAN